MGKSKNSGFFRSYYIADCDLKVGRHRILYGPYSPVDTQRAKSKECDTLPKVKDIFTGILDLNIRCATQTVNLSREKGCITKTRLCNILQLFIAVKIVIFRRKIVTFFLFMLKT